MDYMISQTNNFFYRLLTGYIWLGYIKPANFEKPYDTRRCKYFNFGGGIESTDKCIAMDIENGDMTMESCTNSFDFLCLENVESEFNYLKYYC